MQAEELLLQLRLRGMCAPGEGAAILVEQGYATQRRDKLVLTPDGRREADARFRYDDASPERARVVRAYERFLPLNGAVTQVCSDWQIDRGWKTVERLGALDDKAGPVLLTLGEHVPRYAHYRGLLRQARTQVEDGAHEWFVSPAIDSYHTVWMQLHEDLLLGLGLQRGE
ncbi:MAG TPA: hypothetical protein VIC35_14685 [Acidimicrobiia bacterium]